MYLGIEKLTFWAAISSSSVEGQRENTIAKYDRSFESRHRFSYELNW